MEDFQDVFDAWCDQNRCHHFEGTTGVKKLCKLVSELGYKDDTYFGQHEHGSYGDLITFLEDNPGACEAISEFIFDSGIKEWEKNLRNYVDLDSEE